MGPDSSLTPELIQAQSFTSAFRGYDQSEVRAFLNRLATEIKALRDRAEQLESAWHSAEERAARPPVLDEDTLMAAVGEETASILRSARSAAADLRTRAAEDAEKALSEARAQAARLTEEAAGVLEQAQASAREAAARLVAEARAEVAELIGKARAEADAMRAEAEKDRQLTIEGATTTRDRILEDLARRRRVATVQIEQLRAGRERLIESYAVVRRTLEEAQSELSRADAEARSAADEVGRRLRDETDVELSEDHRLLPPEVLRVPEATPPVADADRPAIEAERAPGDRDQGPLAGNPAPEAGEAALEAGEAALEAGEAALEAGEAPPRAAAITEPVAVPLVEAAPPVEVNGVDELARVDDLGEVTARIEAGATGTGIGGEGPDEAEGPASAVDELFARIRATRVEPRPSGPDGPTEADESIAPTGGDEEGERLSDADESLLQQRESAVVDLETTLTRRLKRALQDEQNDLLDRLRNLRGSPTVDALLPDADAQRARFGDAAQPLLEQAAAAGAEFTAKTLGHADPAATGIDVADLAVDAGAGIVGPLRRRLEQAIEMGAGDDQAVLVESLGSAYREWKTQRIERLAGDVLTAAFSRGTWRAAPEGTLLRWIVEDTDGPCPDCDDDALAGELPRGEAFPTGQHHPPAHSGCRCLLVPIPPPA